MKREYYRAQFMLQPIPEGQPVVAIADRMEADILLELSKENYHFYTDYKNANSKTLRKSDEILLIMPQILFLEKYIDALSKTTEHLFVFIMEGDKLEGEYGDRSYETYLKSNLSEKLPKNVKIFKLKNESVTEFGLHNNYEFSDIQKSLVFRNQIQPIYRKESKIKIL